MAKTHMTGKQAPGFMGNDGAELLKKTREQEDSNEDDADILSERDRQKITHIRSDFHALYEHPLVSRKTRNEYESMLDDLEVRGEVGMMRENIAYLRAMISDAEGYREGFKQELDGALKSKWINQASHDKWWARFNNENTLEWHRKEWITQKFPEYLKGWKEAAEERDKTLKLAQARGVKPSDIPELAAIENMDAFLALDFHARKGRAHAARAAIIAFETGRTRFFGMLKKHLADAAGGGYLHPSKVGTWLKRVMQSAEPEHFATEVLEPFLANWKDARAGFDRLQDRVKTETPPRGMPLPSASKFLLWTYDQRISYIEETNARLDESQTEKSEADRERDFLVRSIRQDMDSKDWEGAELLLHRAKRLYADDPSLPAIERYLAAHRDDLHAEKEQEVSPQLQAEEALTSLRAIVPQIHGSVRHLYELGLHGGSQAFSKVMKVMHARVAHRSQGKATDEDVEQEGEAALQMRASSQQVAVVDDTSDEEATETALYMKDDPDGQASAYSVIQSQAQSADADQSSEGSPRLIPAGLTFEQQLHLVQDINPAMISRLRILERAGMSFTPHGPAVSRN